MPKYKICVARFFALQNGADVQRWAVSPCCAAIPGALPTAGSGKQAAIMVIII